MPQPFNYMLGLQSPMDRVLQGLGAGQGLRAGEQDMAAQRQGMELAQAQEQRDQTAFGWAGEDRQRAISAEAAAAAAAQQEAYMAEQAALERQSAMADLAEKFADGSVTFQDIAAISLQYPDLSTELKSVWDGQTEERRQSDVAGLVQVGAALRAGRPDLATQMLEDYAVAAANAGDQQTADLARAQAGLIGVDPSAAFTGIATTIYALDPDAAKALMGDPTASQKDYQFYVQQETAAGRAPLSFNDWDLQGKRAGASQQTVTVDSSTSDPATKTGQVFDEMKASAAAATAAVAGQRAMAAAEAALTDDAGVVTGFGADWRLGARKLAALVGVGDPDVISNTETFQAAIAPQVGAMIRMITGPTNISNTDREFAEKAAAGSITLDAASIERLFGIMKMASDEIIANHNARLDAVYPEGSGADRERALFSVRPYQAVSGGGVGGVPDGVDPAVWEVMTPEERALFQ